LIIISFFFSGKRISQLPVIMMRWHLIARII